MEIVERYKPMTVRQVFYQAVCAGLIPKTENGYNTVQRLLVDMRKAERMPYGWLVDSTRWMRKPTTYRNVQAYFRAGAQCFRRMLWADQDIQVEVWSEKDAIAGVLYDVTEEFDVPLMVTRGYPSLTYLQECGADLQQDGRPAYIFYFGDCDPSGRDITSKVEKGLRRFAPDVEFHFELTAVTDLQIHLWDLPTRPTKKTDTRAKNFKGPSIEVDAIEPDMLRWLVRNRIEEHIDMSRVISNRETEEGERELLSRITVSGYLDYLKEADDDPD